MWCWWCCHPIEGEPLHFPYKYDDRRRTYHTMGFFCSWACMKTYNLDNGGPRWGERQQFITQMRRDIYGQISHSCPMAPKREALQVFGGNLTIEEFRKNPDVVDIKMPYTIFHSCILPVQTPQVTTQNVTNSNSEQKLRNIQESVNKGEQLKLRRPKPLKSTESALEKTLKLKKKT